MISTDLEAKPPTFQVVALVSHDSEELPYYEDLNHKNEWRWIQCKDRDLGVVQLDPAAVTPSGVSTGQQQRHTTQGESVSMLLPRSSKYEAKIARAERLIGRWYLRTIQEATTDVESTFVIESQS